MPETVSIDPADVPIQPLEKAYQKMNGKETLSIEKFKTLIKEETNFSESTAEEILKTYENKGFLDTNGTKIKRLRIEKIRQENNSENFEVDSNYTQNLTTAEQASYFCDYLIKERGIKPVKVGTGSETRIQTWAFDEEKGTWYRDRDNTKAKRISKKELPRKIFRNNFLSELETNLESSIPLELEEMGLAKYEIALENGILNIKTLEVREIQENDYVLNRLPVKFEKPDTFTNDFEEIGCPKFGEFLQDSIPKEKHRKKIQEFVGYTLMHWTTKYEKALMILGPTDSGKGVFLTIVEYLLGQENVSNHGLQYLANKMWGRQDLASHLANIRHDLNTNVISDMGTAKELVSGDPIMAAKKRQDPVKVNPIAKHLYSANTPPKRKIEDEAFYNRWLTVIFPDSVPKEDQDKELIEKLTGKTRNGEDSIKYEGELPGILNWALIGMKRLIENNGQFTGEISSSATQQLWQQYGSTVDDFKDEFMVKEDGAKIPTRAAYEAYKMYAELEGLEKEGHDGFSRQINEDPEIRKGARKINGKNWAWADGIEKEDSSKRCFIGIRLKSGAVENLKELTGNQELW